MPQEQVKKALSKIVIKREFKVLALIHDLKKGSVKP
jgi:hypothetical protein